MQSTPRQAPPKTPRMRDGSCIIRTSLKSSNTRSVVSFYIARRSEPYDLHAVPVSSLSPHKVDAFAEGLAAQLPTGIDDVLALSDDGEESSVRIVRDDGRRHLAASQLALIHPSLRSQDISFSAMTTGAPFSVCCEKSLRFSSRSPCFTSCRTDHTKRPCTSMLAGGRSRPIV